MSYFLSLFDLLLICRFYGFDTYFCLNSTHLSKFLRIESLYDEYGFGRSWKSVEIQLLAMDYTEGQLILNCM